jgi:hypothetical protein
MLFWIWRGGWFWLERVYWSQIVEPEKEKALKRVDL